MKSAVFLKRFCLFVWVLAAASTAAAQYVVRPVPADSRTNARAVDIMVRPVVPTYVTCANGLLAMTQAACNSVVTATTCPASYVFSGGECRQLAAPDGTQGNYCGRSALYTDTRNFTEQVPCNGGLPYYYAASTAYQPPVAAFCDENGCYPEQPGYSYVTQSLASGCPSGFSLTTTGSSGPYQYFTCIKG